MLFLFAFDRGHAVLRLGKFLVKLYWNMAPGYSERKQRDGWRMVRLKRFALTWVVEKQ